MDSWSGRFKTLLAAVPVTAIVAYLFVSRRRALCAGGREGAAQAQAERCRGERTAKGSRGSVSEDDKQLARPQLHWSYSAGGAPVLLGPAGMVELNQNKVMSPSEKKEMDLMLKFQGRGRSSVPSSFEQAKAKKARQTRKKEACATSETQEVDESFQKMANELSVVELEAMILETGVKAKKAKKTKPRKKKAPEPQEVEVPLEPDADVLSVASGVASEPVDTAPEAPEAPEVPVEESPSIKEEPHLEEEVANTPSTASPAEPEEASDEEPMLQVRSRRQLRKRRRKAEAERLAEKKAAEKAAAEAARAAEAAAAEEAKYKDTQEIVSEDNQDTTIAEDEPSEDTRDAADDASSSDAKEPKNTEEEVKEEKMIDSRSSEVEKVVESRSQDFAKCTGASPAPQGTWHRTELTTRKKWADLVDSDDERM